MLKSQIAKGVRSNSSSRYKQAALLLVQVGSCLSNHQSSGSSNVSTLFGEHIDLHCLLSIGRGKGIVSRHILEAGR